MCRNYFKKASSGWIQNKYTCLPAADGQPEAPSEAVRVLRDAGLPADVPASVHQHRPQGAGTADCCPPGLYQWVAQLIIILLLVTLLLLPLLFLLLLLLILLLVLIILLLLLLLFAIFSDHQQQAGWAISRRLCINEHQECSVWGTLPAL